MHKIFFLLFGVFLGVCHGVESQILHTQGIITRIALFSDKLFIADAQGGIESYRIDKARRAHKVARYALPPIKDYFDNESLPRVFDIASFDGELLYVLAEGSKGSREILKLGKGAPEVIWRTTSSPMRLIAADSGRLVVGFLSNEIGLFDLQKAEFLYKIHPSLAGFSDMCVNAPYIFSTDESGAVSVIGLASGELLRRLDSINKDNNYQIACATSGAQGVVLTAGSDRQLGIYTYALPKAEAARLDFSLQSARSVRSEFLIYAVGISPSGTRAAYSKNEQGDIAILAMPQEILTLRGDGFAPNGLIFYDERTLIASGDDKRVVIWNLGGEQGN